MQNIKMKMVAMAMGAVLAASFAFAQDKDTRLNVNLKDADLVTATKMVTERTGLQFIFKSTKSFNKVTLQLKDQTADDVIRYICDAAGAYVTRDDNGVYVITDEAPKVVVPEITNVAKPAAKIFRKIKLLHAGADEVFAQVVLNRVLDPLTKHAEMYRALNMAKMMVSGSTDYNSAGRSTSQVLNNLSTVNSYQPSSTIPQTNQEVSGNSVALPGTESGNQRGGFGGGNQGGGFGNPGGGQGGGNGGNGFGGGQGNGGTNAQLQPGQGLVPDTIDHISYDPTDNSLIVRGSSEEDINNLQNIIAQFDVRPRQVQIKVEFITTTENLDQSLGYNINYTRGTVVAGMSGSDFLRASDPVFLTYATGDAVLRLRTRLSEGSGRVVTAPILRTMNNTPATVAAYTLDWILTSTTVATNGGFLTTVNPQQQVLGTQLTITPRINADDTITMGLTPNVSTPVGTRSVNSSSGTSFDLPINSIQFAQCVVNVKNRDTIVIGGLNSESTNTTVNRVPVLSDLPIVGQFFRKVVKGRSANELLIFVTPVIIEDDDTSITP
ncbi:MAG: hypothetical protein JST51_12100 [Armatimonadetes bacterium]|nr:hypothetical protein [Armatimonadota bacterium]